MLASSTTTACTGSTWGGARELHGTQVETQQHDGHEGDVHQHRQGARTGALDELPGGHPDGSSWGSVINPTLGAPAFCSRVMT